VARESRAIPFSIGRPLQGTELEVFMLMSSAETIQARIFRVISKSKRINLAAVQSDRTFEELGIDSLDRLNLLFDLESEFGIEIDDEQAKQASKVGDIVAGIQQLLMARERVP